MNTAYNELINTAHHGKTHTIKRLIDSITTKEANKAVSRFSTYFQGDWDDSGGFGHIPSPNDIENTKVIEMLLKKGVDINYQDKYGNTALINASRGQDELEEGQKPTPYKDLIDLLFKYGPPDVSLKNKYGKTAIDYIGGSYILQLMGKDDDAEKKRLEDKFFSFSWNMWKDPNEALQELLSGGIDINAKKNGDNALTYLFENNDMLDAFDKIDYIKALIESGINVEYQNEEGNTALMLIYQMPWSQYYKKRYHQIANILLKHMSKKAINYQNEDGYTALMLAYYSSLNNFAKKSVKDFSLLLDNGADPYIKDKDNDSIFYTVNYKHFNNLFAPMGNFDSFDRDLSDLLRRDIDVDLMTIVQQGVDVRYSHFDLHSLTLSQLRRVYQKVYGKKCPPYSKAKIINLLTVQ